VAWFQCGNLVLPTKKRLRKRPAGRGGAILPRSDVTGLRHRVAYDFPSQGMAHPPQLAGFAVPHSNDVLGKKRYDEIFAIAADCYLSPKGDGIFPKGLNDIKRRHIRLHGRELSLAKATDLGRDVRSIPRIIHSIIR
jgi:hypothetical protein